jgi:uncharacterized protein YggE
MSMYTKYRNLIGSRALPALALLLAGGMVSALLRPSLAYANPMAQGDALEPPYLTVTGEGEARAQPDLAMITVGVTQVAPTAQGAIDAVNQGLAAVLASIRALGIEDRDIQTSGISVQPVYAQGPRAESQPAEITGYRATNQVSVTVRALDRAGPVLDAAVASGANAIGGIRFGLSDTDSLEQQALANAIADANRKAGAVAAAAGRPLGALLTIVESSVSTPRPQAEAALSFAPAGGPAPTPVEPGELVVRARVQVSYRM